MEENQVSVGIDVGGTKIGGALVSLEGTVFDERIVPTPTGPDGADPGSSATFALIDELLTHARRVGLKPVGIGVGVPEYVNPVGNITSSEVLDWPQEGLNPARFPVPLAIESDVRCGARAELRFGVGRPSVASGIGLDRGGSFLYVSIGTGISHTMVIDGVIWPGHRGEALALGEFPVRAELAIRPLSLLTVEQQASGRALELVATTDEVDRRRMVAEVAGQSMAEALTMAVRLLDPPVVVLGGGLGTSEGAFNDSLMFHFGQLTSARPNPPPVVQSALGRRCGVIGAALVGMDAMRGPD